MAPDLHERIHSSTVQQRGEGDAVVVAGWAADVRNLGKIAFITLRDREGTVQITIHPESPQFKEAAGITKESVIAVKGTVHQGKLKSGAKEILLGEMQILSASDPNLPIDITGKIPTSLDKRLDSRFLDLRNPKNLAIFKVRSAINHAMREFLMGERFIEMQTPKIISAGAEGGATLFPVIYYDKKAYLSQSQQLYKQMMLIAGFERIFEIGPSFRAEKSHTMRHLTEFTQLDFEMSFIQDENDVMSVLERMFVHICETVKTQCAEQLTLLGVKIETPNLPFPRVNYKDAITMLNSVGEKLAWGDDIGTEHEKRLGELVKQKYGTDAYFITKYPFSQRAFYIMADGDVSRGFDFEYKGEELVSGGQREHRHEVLCSQITGKGLNLQTFTFYTDPFKYGAPPHGGFGMGIDRLTKKLLNLDNIREAVLYPRDPERLVP